MEPDSSRIGVADLLEPFRKAWLSPEVPADDGPLGFDFDGVVIEFHELRDIGLVEQLDPLPYQVRLFPQHLTPSVCGRPFGYFRWAPPVGAGSSWPFKNPPAGTVSRNGRKGHEGIDGACSVRRVPLRSGLPPALAGTIARRIAAASELSEGDAVYADSCWTSGVTTPPPP